MADLFVVAVLHAKNGQEDRLRTDLTAIVGPSRKDEGNLRYDLFADQGDRGRFVLVQQWTDRVAYQKHDQQGPQIAHFREHGASAVEKADVFLLDMIA
ncbi:MAG TPA: putative quinol monooxygenase [Terrimicrobiaceae bacterium]|nr:putative quinol monooxygenase [Terrimicrobiaceae bacterium]